MESVSGGGHWGGGVFIHAEDQARIGLLMARRGAWGGGGCCRRSGSAPTSSCAIKPAYGLLWWLNTGRRPAERPARQLLRHRRRRQRHLDRSRHDIVAVLRWIDPAAVDGWIARVLAAMA